jgi:hypothetical protein
VIAVLSYLWLKEERAIVPREIQKKLKRGKNCEKLKDLINLMGEAMRGRRK